MFARFFVDRPIFATVISVLIVVVGGVALVRLPIAQYPEVAPPCIQVTATYPGASAATVASTVVTPLEAQINGVEGMLYMASRCTNDGSATIDVTFALGTDLNMAQVLVQNRVAIATVSLPSDVQRIGVKTKKKSPSMLLSVNIVSPKGTRSQLYMSNFATLNIIDDLARITGVSDIVLNGARDYSMRVWLDPAKLASLSMTSSEVVRAIQEQNVQVAAGRLGQPPLPEGTVLDFDIPLNTLGRLETEEQFASIIVRAGSDSQLVRLRDIVRDTRYGPDGEVTEKGVALGAQNYEVNCNLDGMPSVMIAIYPLPGANAVATADAVREKMKELEERFPPDLEYRMYYDTTVFIDESIHEVYKTLFEAFVLVFIVVLIFLQDWRATLMPMIDVPVSLIGTFAVMSLMGFSLNNLSLFGLVLAIGIVVDDAIVVVENIERWMAKGLPPREATIKAMDEITGPVIAITLVLSSVFIPTAFLAGIVGQFYKQFALTIATATIISAINAMTMAPARAVTLIKPHTPGHGSGERQALPALAVVFLLGLIVSHFLEGPIGGVLGFVMEAAEGKPLTSQAAIWGLRLGLFAAGCGIGWLTCRYINRALNWFLSFFNRFFDWLSDSYSRVVRRVLRVSAIIAVIYVGLLALTGWGFSRLPKGFIPLQDKGYLMVNVQLPEGASLQRTTEVIGRVAKMTRDTPGVGHAIEVAGYSILNSVRASNAGALFVILEPFEDRKHDPKRNGLAIVRTLNAEYREIQGAIVNAFPAAPVDGLGTTGGTKMQIQDRRNAGLRALEGATLSLVEGAHERPELASLFSSFRVSQPQKYITIDREKAKAAQVSLSDINLALQSLIGSYYVNDFSFQGRNWQVNLQADPAKRLRPDDVAQLEVHNLTGGRVRLGTLIEIADMTGPAAVYHYNMYPSADLVGGPAPGYSSGQCIQAMEQLAKERLPSTLGYEWTDLAYQQIEAGKDTLSVLIFPLAVLFVFLVLAAQYESWSLPFVILLIVPMVVLSALAGVWAFGLDINIFVQIGFVVLIGLAAKNAILVVEFAKQQEEESGLSKEDAVIQACKTRLRPILMTAFAFILGCIPLMVSKGAGAEMRMPLGTAVVFGMTGVTFIGLFFTPVFYTLIHRRKGKPARGLTHMGARLTDIVRRSDRK